MRFNRSTPPPDYMSNRFRFRLLGLVVALGLLVIVAEMAIQPEKWYWLTGRPAEEAEKSRFTPEQEAEIAKSRSAQALSPEEMPLREGEFRIPAEGEAPKEKTPEPPAPEADIAVTAPGSRVQLNPNLLKKVADNTGSIRVQESEAYYAILGLVRDLPPEELAAASQDSLAYTALVDNPELYRGQIISVRGTLQLAYKLPAVPNSSQVGDTWEAWVLTTDSGRRPYRVVALNIPEDFPVGDVQRDGMHVTLTGYFFKSYGYPRQDGSSQVAPLLLVRDIHKASAPTGISSTSLSEYLPYLLGGLLTLGAAAGLVIWRVRKSDKQFEREQLDRLTRASEEDLEALKGLPTTSPEEFLQQLTQEETATTAPRRNG